MNPNWQDNAIILDTRIHNETGVIVDIFSQTYGRVSGYVAGGQSHKKKPFLQAGNLVKAQRIARTNQQLGRLDLQPERNYTAAFLTDSDRLLTIQSACALVQATTPEGHPYPILFDGLISLLDHFNQEIWAELYVHWESALLQLLGFGLDVSSCAVTGKIEDLSHISPRTGRAVHKSVAAQYPNKLLALPQFLLYPQPATAEDITNGLKATGFFLERYLLAQTHRPLPSARQRLIEKWLAKSNEFADCKDLDPKMAQQA